MSGRLIAGRGVGPALAVLPLALLVGTAGLVLLPGLLLATVLRGADNSLRKSIFRPTLEILYLPLPVNLRRRTKTFIDTVLDTVSESMGAAIIFLMVTLLDLSSVFLSIIVVLLALLFLLPAGSHGTVIRVPDDVPQVRTALLLAAPLVWNGWRTYFDTSSAQHRSLPQ